MCKMLIVFSVTTGACERSGERESEKTSGAGGRRAGMEI